MQFVLEGWSNLDYPIGNLMWGIRQCSILMQVQFLLSLVVLQIRRIGGKSCCRSQIRSASSRLNYLPTYYLVCIFQSCRVLAGWQWCALKFCIRCDNVSSTILDLPCLKRSVGVWHQSLVFRYFDFALCGAWEAWTVDSYFRANEESTHIGGS